MKARPIAGLPVCLNLTYGCNARCRHCHCGCDFLDGTGTTLSMAQVGAFCESLEGRLVKSFRIAGGEPTTVPHLREAVWLIAGRLKFNCRDRNKPHVSTNGLMPGQNLPPGWHYRVDPPASKRQFHEPVWWSPVDLGIDPGEYVCRMPAFCGRTYDYCGWTFCQISTQLGRVLGIDARTTGPDDPPKPEICRHCWYSVEPDVRRATAARILAGEIKAPTATWEAAIATAPKRK